MTTNLTDYTNTHHSVRVCLRDVLDRRTEEQVFSCLTEWFVSHKIHRIHESARALLVLYIRGEHFLF